MQTVTLIIDKRPELSTKYKKLLQNSTNQVTVTKDLISAMKIIQDKEPDLIIISDSIDTDLSDYCRKIRALTYSMRPIIVALSKSAEFEDRIKVLENGADDFLSEPVNNEEFVMRIKAHLRREYESNLDNKKLLPNKNYSLRALKRILSDDFEWAAMYVSIENFENYKDTYTELASDKLVQTYIAIIRSALNENDYLGTLTDNGFLIITDRIKSEKIANFLTFAFDTVASKFYSQADINRGFMIMQGDEYAGRRSDFVHTTIGVITNEFNKYTDTAQLINSIVHVHNMANKPSKSNYLIERPKITAEDATLEKTYNNQILIIEDDEAMSLLLTTILELQGYSVTVINANTNIDEALSPALIILDAGNAETQTGLDICRIVRSEEKYNNTKVIVTSIFHDKELILGCGADLYLPKPYDISSLVKWVEVFMKEVNA